MSVQPLFAIFSQHIFVEDEANEKFRQYTEAFGEPNARMRNHGESLARDERDNSPNGAWWPYLQITSSPQHRPRYQDKGRGWILGYRADCDIVMGSKDSKVNSQHLEIIPRETPGTFTVLNIGSNFVRMKCPLNEEVFIVVQQHGHRIMSSGKNHNAAEHQMAVDQHVLISKILMQLCPSDIRQNNFKQLWAAVYAPYRATGRLAISPPPSSSYVSRYDAQDEFFSHPDYVIFTAKDQDTNNTVLVKRYTNRNAARHIVGLEVAVHGKLKHENVMQLIDYDLDQCEIVFQNFDGGTLQKQHRITPLTLSEFKTMAAQLLNALSDMHRKSIYHGNITADNVFMKRPRVLQTASKGSPSIHVKLGNFTANTLPIAGGVRQDLYSLLQLFLQLLMGNSFDPEIDLFENSLRLGPDVKGFLQQMQGFNDTDWATTALDSIFLIDDKTQTREDIILPLSLPPCPPPNHITQRGNSSQSPSVPDTAPCHEDGENGSTVDGADEDCIFCCTIGVRRVSIRRSGGLGEYHYMLNISELLLAADVSNSSRYVLRKRLMERNPELVQKEGRGSQTVYWMEYSACRDLVRRLGLESPLQTLFERATSEVRRGR